MSRPRLSETFDFDNKGHLQLSASKRKGVDNMLVDEGWPLAQQECLLAWLCRTLEHAVLRQRLTDAVTPGTVSRRRRLAKKDARTLTAAATQAGAALNSDEVREAAHRIRVFNVDVGRLFIAASITTDVINQILKGPLRLLTGPVPSNPRGAPRWVDWNVTVDDVADWFVLHSLPHGGPDDLFHALLRWCFPTRTDPGNGSHRQRVAQAFSAARRSQRRQAYVIEWHHVQQPTCQRLLVDRLQNDAGLS
jgi:hypothetical protein